VKCGRGEKGEGVVVVWRLRLRLVGGVESRVM